MNNEEFIMNNKRLPVGAAWHAAQKHTDKNNLAHVGACIARPSGITLIALIITIIVMLILAGVVLNLTVGERGIFKTAKNAGTEYKKSEVKEEIQLALIEIEAEELEKGNIVTLEKLAGEENLLGKKLNEITSNLGENNITGIYKGYEYEIDEKFHVTIEDSNNISISAKVVEGTAGEEEWYRTDVVVKLTAKKGKNEDIAKIVYKINENQEVEVEGKETDITLNTEGEYAINYYVVSTNGNKTEQVEKKIKIDKTKPTNVTIAEKETFGNSSTVNLTATEELSGISKYEIYFDNTKKMETKETTAEIVGLNQGTTTVYAKAVDKAGNVSENSISITIETTVACVKYPITFEKMEYIEINDEYYFDTNSISKIGETLFDNNLKNGSKGGLMLDIYTPSYLIFSTEKKVKIEAYGDTYSDSGGSSDNGVILISKYNKETGEFEQYKTVTPSVREWYEMATLEPGRYKITPLDSYGYIRFDEWRLTEQ